MTTTFQAEQELDYYLEDADRAYRLGQLTNTQRNFRVDEVRNLLDSEKSMSIKEVKDYLALITKKSHSVK